MRQTGLTSNDFKKTSGAKSATLFFSFSEFRFVTRRHKPELETNTFDHTLDRIKNAISDPLSLNRFATPNVLFYFPNTNRSAREL